jgi:hypothetical protein
MNKNPEEFQKEMNMFLIEPFLETLEKTTSVDIERDFKLFLISINYKEKIQMDIRIFEDHIECFWFDKNCKLIDNDNILFLDKHFKQTFEYILNTVLGNILEQRTMMLLKRRNLRRH